MNDRPVRMTKEEMKIGLAAGRRLTQEEWANKDEQKWVDELVAEAKAIATPWAYNDNFQCEVRFIRGKK